MAWNSVFSKGTYSWKVKNSSRIQQPRCGWSNCERFGDQGRCCCWCLSQTWGWRGTLSAITDCYNKMPLTKWHKWCWVLTVLGAGSPRSARSTVRLWWGLSSWFLDSHLIYIIGKKARELSGGCCIWELNSFRKILPHGLITSQSPYLLLPWHWGSGFQHRDFDGGHCTNMYLITGIHSDICQKAAQSLERIYKNSQILRHHQLWTLL